MSANVLLVGGAGFLGSHVARAFVARGHRVTSLSRTKRSRVDGVVSLVADRRDASALAAALDGKRFDFTVDLAAYDAADVEGLLLVPYAATGRYVLVSTGQVYLVTRDAKPPYREEDSAGTVMDEPAPGSPDHAGWAYGVGKRRAEGALQAIRQSYGVRAHVLRLPILQGEGDVSLRLWAWVERLLDGGPIVLPDGGRTPVRHLLAADAARLLVRWLEGAPPRESVYNFAPIESTTLADVIALLARTLGVEPRIVPAPADELAAAGLPISTYPYASRWASVLDPARAVAEFAIVPERVLDYLPALARALARERPDEHDMGYVLRERELEFARARAGA